MKKIIVTGAGGFVGRHVIAPLLERGFEVHVLVRTGADGFGDGVVVHEVDLLRDQDRFSEIMGEIGASHLLHLAWCVEPGVFWNTRENLDWVGASLALYRAFVAAGGKRIVGAGTCAEYEWSALTTTDILDEVEAVQVPSTLYGRCKLSLFEMLREAAALDEVSFGWGRIFFLYGPGEKRGRLMSDVMAGLLAGETVETTAGTQIRDFMHVADVASAFAALCDCDVDGAVNIASGEARAMADILREIERQVGCKGDELLKLGARPMPANDPLAIVADVSRLRDEVGFVTQFSIEEGIADSVGYWSSL